VHGGDSRETLAKCLGGHSSAGTPSCMLLLGVSLRHVLPRPTLARCVRWYNCRCNTGPRAVAALPPAPVVSRSSDQLTSRSPIGLLVHSVSLARIPCIGLLVHSVSLARIPCSGLLVHSVSHAPPSVVHVQWAHVRQHAGSRLGAPRHDGPLGACQLVAQASATLCRLPLTHIGDGASPCCMVLLQRERPRFSAR
jgi:hypothetical protein